MITPKHLKKIVNDDYRLIVISDIHGHLDRLRSLLKKVHYTPEDYLVILGDFVEKGDQVRETIAYIKKLDENERTFVLMGNCEWAIDALLTIPELAGEIPKYLKRVSSNGCIREAYQKLHLADGSETMLGIQRKIAEYLKEEGDYISHLPVTLKFNQFLFVHAGVERRKDYKKSSLSSLLEMQHFYEQGHLLDEIVVVGHLPTSNYNEHHIDNHIIIDEEKKMICIDGGVGVKKISQLNALIIESHQGQITYKEEYVQPLPYYTVVQDVIAKEHTPHKINFPYFEIEVLKEEEQFSLCYQRDTDQKMYIKNEFIYEKQGRTYCLDDYTDAIITAYQGERVKLLGIFDRFAYVIKDNQVGWILLDYLSI